MGENGVGRENCDKIEKFRHIDKNELILRKDKIKGGYSKKISYSDFSDSAMSFDFGAQPCLCCGYGEWFDEIFMSSAFLDALPASKL